MKIISHKKRMDIQRQISRMRIRCKKTQDSIERKERILMDSRTKLAKKLSWDIFYLIESFEEENDLEFQFLDKNDDDYRLFDVIWAEKELDE